MINSKSTSKIVTQAEAPVTEAPNDAASTFLQKWSDFQKTLGFKILQERNESLISEITARSATQLRGLFSKEYLMAVAQILNAFVKYLDDHDERWLEKIKSLQAAVKEEADALDASRKEAEAIFDVVEKDGFAGLQSYIREHPPCDKTIFMLIAVANGKFEKDFKNTVARLNASKKASKYTSAKKFVLDDWKKNKNEYKSKMDFARCWSDWLSKDPRHKDIKVDVTPETIARWLRKG